METDAKLIKFPDGSQNRNRNMRKGQRQNY
jgi:hypothetical protein